MTSVHRTSSSAEILRNAGPAWSPDSQRPRQTSVWCSSSGRSIYLSVSGAKFIWSPTRFSWPEPPLLLSVSAEGVLAIGYLTAGWAISGRTFGKSLLGLRVVSLRGRLLGWTRAFVRAVFCVFFPVGLFWVLFSPSRRSLQDIALRSMVIYDWTKIGDHTG